MFAEDNAGARENGAMDADTGAIVGRGNAGAKLASPGISGSSGVVNTRCRTRNNVLLPRFSRLGAKHEFSNCPIISSVDGARPRNILPYHSWYFSAIVCNETPS